MHERLIISEALLRRLLYLWTRDAEFTPFDSLSTAYIADYLEAITDPEFGLAVPPAQRVLDPIREEWCRHLVNYCRPGTVLPAPECKGLPA